MFSGTIRSNIDFAGIFKDETWKIVKILSYLGFFNTLKESMNLDDGFEILKMAIMNEKKSPNTESLNKLDKSVVYGTMSIEIKNLLGFCIYGIII